MVKRAKNATFLYKPEALRLGEGQVSTFWLMSLRLGEEKLRLCELVLLDMLCFFFCLLCYLFCFRFLQDPRK